MLLMMARSTLDIWNIQIRKPLVVTCGVCSESTIWVLARMGFTKPETAGQGWEGGCWNWTTRLKAQIYEKTWRSPNCFSWIHAAKACFTSRNKQVTCFARHLRLSCTLLDLFDHRIDGYNMPSSKAMVELYACCLNPLGNQWFFR